MKISYQIIAISVIVLLTSCASQKSPTQMASNFLNRQSVEMTTKETYTARNPKAITLFTEQKTPHTAYRVIGIATVSRYNLIGVERKNNTLEEMIKSLAASVGGDGLIDIQTDRESIRANVIQFQRILI